MRITLLGDRGFGSQDFYSFLKALGIDYIIRFEESTLVDGSDGQTRPAREYVPQNGCAHALLNARVTADKKQVAVVVCKQEKGMKQAWCLASSRADLLPSEIVNLYALRFTIEERLRDTKNEHVGMGLSATRIRSCERRDRLLLVIALSQVLLCILGEYYYQALLTMKLESAAALLTRFDQLLRKHPQCRELFALL